MFTTFLLIRLLTSYSSFFFFFNDTATTEIYTLSLHDALPIYRGTHARAGGVSLRPRHDGREIGLREVVRGLRSEEHTSELQSPDHLVCRLLLEKKKISDVYALNGTGIIIRVSHESYRTPRQCY